jgi:hypothetical protein
MALIPPAILAALLGASVGNAIKRVNNPQPKNRITLEPFPGNDYSPPGATNATMVKSTPVKKVVDQAIQQIMAGSAQSIRKKRQGRRSRRSVTTTVSQPTARSGISRNIAMDGITLSHSEPFGSLSMIAGGALGYFGTPMLPWNFPYLTGLAANFAKYKWLKLRVYYVPSCPTTTQGECAIGSYFDQQDAIAATFIQVAQMKGGISFPPWGGGAEYGKDAVCLEYDVQNFEKPFWKYISQAAWTALTVSDRNQYTPANLAVATQGSTLATFAGRLWCDYTVRLVDPIPAGINA